MDEVDEIAVPLAQLAQLVSRTPAHEQTTAPRRSARLQARLATFEPLMANFAENSSDFIATRQVRHVRQHHWAWQPLDMVKSCISRSRVTPLDSWRNETQATSSRLATHHPSLGLSDNGRRLSLMRTSSIAHHILLLLMN